MASWSRARRSRQLGLRGIDKIEAEFGLIAMAHNLKKVSLAY